MRNSRQTLRRYRISPCRHCSSATISVGRCSTLMDAWSEMVLGRRLAVFLGPVVLLSLAAVPAAADQRDDFLAGRTVSCPGCDLHNAELKRRDLTGANLAGADLTFATLHAATLQGADLTGAKLTDANLNLADLRNAKLTGAEMSRVLAYGANLTSANLTRAQMEEAKLQTD